MEDNEGRKRELSNLTAGFTVEQRLELVKAMDRFIQQQVTDVEERLLARMERENSQ